MTRESSSIDLVVLRHLCNDIFSLLVNGSNVISYVNNSLKEIARKWQNDASGVATCKPIHSITNFEVPSSLPIVVDNPKVAKTKGSSKGGRLAKNSKRFISRRESMVPKERTCSKCGEKGHNRHGCHSKIQE